MQRAMGKYPFERHIIRGGVLTPLGRVEWAVSPERRSEIQHYLGHVHAPTSEGWLKIETQREGFLTRNFLAKIDMENSSLPQLLALSKKIFLISGHVVVGACKEVVL